MTVVTVILVIAAVALPPTLQFAAMVILHRASTGGPIMALLERLRVAQAGFVGSLIISGLAINGALDRPIPIEPPLSTAIIALALLIIAAPAGVFVWLYFSGSFGDEG